MSMKKDVAKERLTVMEMDSAAAPVKIAMILILTYSQQLKKNATEWIMTATAK